MAGSIGWETWAGHGAGASRWGVSGVLQGPWVPGGAWGGRRTGRRTSPKTERTPAALTAPRSHAHRPRIAWRRLAALTGDVLMVLVWAAMIPGMMWLGAVAGF
ncbi:MAG: hypothetical protein WBF69_06125 [Castellaniella sp.]|uniref:hypothetical protein n=1 Tax=Castellaniella sp. TaxID=1955812 RepID=UPI003C77292D